MMFLKHSRFMVEESRSSRKGCECLEKSFPNCDLLLEDCALIAHFKLMETKRHNLHVTSKPIFIVATLGGLITLWRVLIIPFCFGFTLRTMFISSLGVVNLRIKNIFKNLTFVSPYLFLVVWLLFACVFLFFFCLFCVSYELSWCLVIAFRCSKFDSKNS